MSEACLAATHVTHRAVDIGAAVAQYGIGIHGLEALLPEMRSPRKAEIERRLLAHCELGTLAMVRVWAAFSSKVPSFALTEPQ